MTVMHIYLYLQLCLSMYAHTHTYAHIFLVTIKGNSSYKRYDQMMKNIMWVDVRDTVSGRVLASVSHVGGARHFRGY